MSDPGRHSLPLPPHHLYRGFLADEERSALLDWALSNRERFGPSKLGTGALDPAIRRSESLRDLGPFESLLDRRLRETAPDIFARTGTRPFEIEHVERVMIAYGEGAHFARHTDIPLGPGRKPLGGDRSGRQDRLISAVYYFHSEPKGFSGGALRLHRFGGKGDPGDYVDIQPEQNSLLVFPAWAIHEVREVHCPSGRFEDGRFAVNCWLCRALS